MIRLTCNACGGSLEIEPGQKVMMCPFCGTRFIESNVTNNYNIANGQIHAERINISTDSLSKDSKLKAAQGHIRLGNYEVAYQLLQDLVLYFPEDVQVRTAMFDCISLNQRRQDYNEAEFGALQEQFDVIAKLDRGKCAEIQSYYDQASNKFCVAREELIDARSDENYYNSKASSCFSTSRYFKAFTFISLALWIVMLIANGRGKWLFFVSMVVCLIGWFVSKSGSTNNRELAELQNERAAGLSEKIESSEIRF